MNDSHDFLLRVLHFKFLQNLNCWRIFFEKKLKQHGIIRCPIEHSAALFLLSILSTQISHHIDEDLFAAELAHQTPEVKEYIKRYGEKIINSYSIALYDYLLSQNPTREGYYSAGRLIYHQLFECDLDLDPKNCNETAEDQLLLDCASQMDEIYWRNLDFSIYAEECVSGQKKLGFASNDRLDRDDKKVLKQFAAVRKSLHDFFLPRRACYVDEIAFDFELDILSFFIVDEASEVADVSVLSKRYPGLSFEFVNEEAIPLYREGRKKEKLGHVAYARLCCAAGCVFDLDYLLQVHISEAACEDAENCISSIYERFSASFSDRQKLFLCLAGTSVLMLLLTICNVLFSRYSFPYGYYVFLRIVTCGALVGLMLNRLPLWAKFVLLLFAILYNPVIQIHLGDSENWIPFNLATIPILIIAWVMAIRRIPEEKTDGPR